MFARIRLYVCFVCCVITTYSCIDSHEEIVHKLELSVDELPIINSNGEIVTFKVTSTMPWSVGEVQEWCVVSPALGLAGTTDVKVACSENTSYDERNSGISISSGTFSKKLLVTQKQKDALLLSSNKVEMDSDGGESILEIRTNIAYEYEVEESCIDWIKIKGSRGLIKETLCIEVAKNNDTQKREGKIRIKTNSWDEVVTIYQEGFDPTLVLSHNEYNVDSGENTIKIELKSNVDYEMVLPKNISWIQEVESRAVSSYTHYLNISANETYDMRKAEIYFLNKEFDIKEKVIVTQMQHDAIFVTQDEYVISASTTELTFNINTNVDFEINTSVDWIKEKWEMSRALEVVPIKISINENVSLSPREGYIYISFKNIQQTIKIIQNGRIDYGRLSITHVNSQFQIPHLVGNNIIGNINWGDGQTDEYKKEVTHSYNDDSKHTVTVESWGAKEVQFLGIRGISEIDLSEF